MHDLCPILLLVEEHPLAPRPSFCRTTIRPPINFLCKLSLQLNEIDAYDMAMNETSQPPILRADYHAPGESNSFSQPLPTLGRGFSTKDKTQYLSGLRASVIAMQKDINVFLTAKMDEDKAKAATEGAKVDDTKEEENYGEEVGEEG